VKFSKKFITNPVGAVSICIASLYIGQREIEPATGLTAEKKKKMMEILDLLQDLWQGRPKRWGNDEKLGD
jgi:hypothetical protein